MKYSYGGVSSHRLSTCTDFIQRVMRLALSRGLIDITIIQGRRSKALQNKYYPKRSKVKWPNSKHNVLNPEDLAQAVDAAPFVNGKVSWKKEHCIFLAGIVQSCAIELGGAIRWGGNWDMDGEPITDQDFQDLVHFEEVKSNIERS